MKIHVINGSPKGKFSITLQTVKYLEKLYPEHEFYFIIGADSLFNIEKWKYPERLLKTCVILAAFRDGKNKKEMGEQIAYLNEKYGSDIHLLSTPNVDISSSEIREKLRRREDVTDVMPACVYEYILVNQLYGEAEDESD